MSAPVCVHLQIVEEIVGGIMEKIPGPIDVEEVMTKYPVLYEESMNTVLIQEVIRYPSVPPSLNTDGCKGITLTSRKHNMKTLPLSHNKFYWQFSYIMPLYFFRYNKLLAVISSSLVDLVKALKGLVVMSSELELMANSLFINAVPDMWKAKARCLAYNNYSTRHVFAEF